MVTWQVERTKHSYHFGEAWIVQVSNVFADGFGSMNGWPLREVRLALQRSNLIGLLRSANDKIEGYAFFTLPDALLAGTSLLWEDAVCLRKQYQGQGLTSQPLFDAIRTQLGGKRVGWLGGRTQNPSMLQRYARFGALYPFDKNYSEDDGADVLSYLLEHIAEVREVERKLDRTTGICRAVYSGGRLGDYELRGGAASIFDAQLQRWQFRREQGDAIVAVARLAQPIVG